MKENTGKYLLWTLIFVVLVIKLFLLIQTPYSNYDSYYGLRYSEHVKNHFSPMIVDNLSYQGRVSIHNLFFYFITSIISFFIPVILIYKYFTLFLSLIMIYLVYKIVFKMFDNSLIAIIVSFICVSVPTLFNYYPNTFSSKSLFLVLFLYLIYLFSNLENDKNVISFLVTFIILTIITPYSLILILGFLVYLFFLKIESLPIKKSTIEVLFFSLLFSFWYNLLIYKHSLKKYGLSILWQNIPVDLINLSYIKINLFSAIILIGIVPFVLGLFGIYKTFTEKRKRILILMSAFSLVFFILLWLRVLPIYEGVMFLVLCLVILSSGAINFIVEYFDKTLFSKTKYFLLILIIFFSSLNFIVAIALTNETINYSPLEDEIITLNFIEKNVPFDATILGDVIEGHFISYEANRKNFYDENFFLMQTAPQRFDDSKKMFLSKSLNNIIELMDYYSIDYIYISRLTKERYARNTFLISEDDCFEKIFYTNTTEVYKRKCKL